MGSFIKKIFKFLFFVFFVYIILLLLWGDFMPNFAKQNLKYIHFRQGHLNSRLKEVQKIKYIDILFLGSSRSFRQYDTRIFEKAGYTAFNLGSSAQTLAQTEILLDRYFDGINPKLIVFDIYPGMLTADGIESSLDLISNDHNDLESLKLAIDHNNILVYNTLIYSVYRDFFYNQQNKREKRNKGQDSYIDGGFVERKLKFSKIEFPEDKKIVFKENQLESFHNVIRIIKKRKIKLIMIQSPMHKSRRDSYTNIYKMDSLMEINNLQFYDLSNNVKLNEKLHFYDPAHLNQDGVRIFNEFLIEKILEYEYSSLYDLN